MMPRPNDNQREHIRASKEAPVLDEESKAITTALSHYRDARESLRAAFTEWNKTEHTAEADATLRMIVSLNEGLAMSEEGPHA